MLKLNKSEAINFMNNAGKNQEAFFMLSDFQGLNFEFWNEADLNQRKILVDFPSYKNVSEDYDREGNTKIELINQLTIKEYQKSFQLIQDALQRGDTYLCNLTFQQEIGIVTNLETLFNLAVARYKIYSPNQFLCFSPETFIEIKAEQITTYPMKGTFPAHQKEALSSSKEIAEHATVVDLLRNDLSIVASNVKVENFRYFEEIKTASGDTYLQSSSKISGSLPLNWRERLGEIYTELLPPGSVTGAPKQKTIEIILATENYKRKFYTGTACYFDGRELTSCVLIRFIEKVGEKYFFKSGGGITSESVMADEYQELINKIYVPISRKY